ncbi:hypothetical protein [Dictyobacter aurantiacus]|uniref:Uncharacterized protein n=1 Tax=Dictyobacter aurantiacus TaxID=1936993 RepID=A0A401ZJY1_9CHLR|nr:hypothetical protein [Dictyobacter aurantiacus]GCE07142.1 hypothetical protein KDAU_44710 [Dictyobacter aurantiacus]
MSKNKRTKKFPDSPKDTPREGIFDPEIDGWAEEADEDHFDHPLDKEDFDFENPSGKYTPRGPKSSKYGYLGKDRD